MTDREAHTLQDHSRRLREENARLDWDARKYRFLFTVALIALAGVGMRLIAEMMG